MLIKSICFATQNRHHEFETGAGCLCHRTFSVHKSTADCCTGVTYKMRWTMAAYLQAAPQTHVQLPYANMPSNQPLPGSPLVTAVCIGATKSNTTQLTMTGDCSSKTTAYFQPSEPTLLESCGSLHAYTPKPLLAVLFAMASWHPLTLHHDSHHAM